MKRADERTRTAFLLITSWLVAILERTITCPYVVYRSRIPSRGGVYARDARAKAADARGPGAPRIRRGRRAPGGRRPPRAGGRDSGDLHTGPHARSPKPLPGATEGLGSGRRADGGGGHLNGPNPQLTLDVGEAARSVR